MTPLDRVLTAGIYDYLLGGGYNFAADRAAAHRLLRIVPQARNWAHASRYFHRRAVLRMVDAGVSQFLDLGCGLPSVAATHEIVHEVDPTCRVAYVDNDPVVVECNRLHIGRDPRGGVIHADLRDVDRVLRHAVHRSLLDLREPLGVLMGAVLHHIPAPADIVGVIARCHERSAPGSVLAASHVTAAGLTSRQRQCLDLLFGSLGISVTTSSRTEFARLLGPWQPDGDGVAPLWRHDPDVGCLGYGVLAHKMPAVAQLGTPVEQLFAR